MSLQNKKSLGQNWLKDRIILDEIAELARGQSTEKICIEIGPGLGTLTSSLLRQFPRVLAIEFDGKLAKNLPNSFPGKNLEVINDDFLRFDLSTIKEPYIVAGNIPYYITSPIIKKLLTAENRPKRIVLLIQNEVAERLAKGKGQHTVISLFVQNHAKIELGPLVKKEYFTPVPKVDSRIIIMEPRKESIIPDEVFSLIKRGFSAPRKKLIKNLGQHPKDELIDIFENNNISKDARPQDLDLLDWQNLYKAF